MRKLISLNTEGHRHLARIMPFLQAEQPDIVCLQEVFAADIPLYEQTLGMTGHWAGMADVVETSIHQAQALGPWGIAQFTRCPIIAKGQHRYVSQAEELPVFFFDNQPNHMHRYLLTMTIPDSDPDVPPLVIGTTHFTWSTGGSFTEEQARDFEALREVLKHFPELILCGDFNSPRLPDQDNVYQRLATHYRDYIPPAVVTTLDPELHKAGPLNLVVDGLFASPEYAISQVKVVSGVSDHQAIVAEVAPRPKSL